MNLQEASKHIIQQLKTNYEQREAENICNILLEEFTGLNKVQRLVAATTTLSEQQQRNIDTALQQLLLHKPLQQVLGYTWFYHNKFIVNENVLIPRPETEELVDVIIKENQHQSISILDIGTGSGCIAISLQLNLHNATVTAIDISNKALYIAQQNAQQLNANIHFIELDFLNESHWQQLPQFDIIVSNPPYITYEEKNEMHKNVLDHEPHLALFTPNNDALIFYRKIAAFAQAHLKLNGKIYVEINETLSHQTQEIFTSNNYTTTVLKDLQRKDRMIRIVGK